MVHLVPLQAEVLVRVDIFLVLTSWLVHSSCIEHGVTLLHALKVCMACSVKMRQVMY